MTDAREYAIETRELTKVYAGKTVANDRISLSVPSGITLGLLGSNGAGKTTLVRQITGELRPSSGSVRVMGIDVAAEPTRARAHLGIVPQDVEPYDHLRPREHLELFARLRGLSWRHARRRAAETMETLGLTEHERMFARELSGGLKRKLLVGTALISEPAVLVLDEPTTGLDPHSRREVWSVLRGLRGRGCTTVITTHYMEEAEELCDEVALISGGRIYVQGTVEDLRARCRNRFRATYENGAGRCDVFGQTADEVLLALRGKGIEQFSLAKSSLEDVYLELTSESLVTTA